MSAMIQTGINAECQGIKVGTAQAAKGIELGVESSARDIEVTGAYTEGDVVANGLRNTVDNVRHASGTTLAVVYVEVDYATVSNIHSVGSATGGAVYVNTAIDVSLSNIVSVNDATGIVISQSNWFSVKGAHIRNAAGTAVSIISSGFGTFDGILDQCKQHGLQLSSASGCKITGQFYQCGSDANDTYDNINITGASDRNLITGAQFRGLTAGNATRSAVNIGGTGECNMVAGNDLGDPDDYGTDAIIDAASNTQLFWPADPTYGDNFTDCGSGS